MIQFNELSVTKDNRKLVIDASVKEESYYTNVYLDRIYIDTQDTYIEGAPSTTAQYFLPTDAKIVKLTEADFVHTSDDPHIDTLNYIGPTLEYGTVYDFTGFNGYDMTNDILVTFKSDTYNFEYDAIDIQGQWYIFDEEYNDFSNAHVKSFRFELPEALLDKGLKDNLLIVYAKSSGTPSSDVPCGKDNIYTIGVTANLYPIYQRTFNYVKEVENTCAVPKSFIDHILQYKALSLAIKVGQYTQAVKYWKKFYTGISDTKINCDCYG